MSIFWEWRKPQPPCFSRPNCGFFSSVNAKNLHEKMSSHLVEFCGNSKKNLLFHFSLCIYIFFLIYLSILFFSCVFFFFFFFYPWLLVHDTILRKFTMKFWFHSRYFYLGLVKKKMSSHAKPLQHVYKAILRVMYGLRKFMLRFHTWCNFFHAFSSLSLVAGM